MSAAGFGAARWRLRGPRVFSDMNELAMAVAPVEMKASLVRERERVQDTMPVPQVVQPLSFLPPPPSCHQRAHAHTHAHLPSSPTHTHSPPSSCHERKNEPRHPKTRNTSLQKTKRVLNTTTLSHAEVVSPCNSHTSLQLDTPACPSRFGALGCSLLCTCRILVRPHQCVPPPRRAPSSNLDLRRGATSA